MTEFTALDTAMMARAIRLAARGRYSAHPNPRVGCVIASGDKIAGEGWHAAAGEAHAEINALADAGPRSTGATAYVSLEPCCHEGRTGPCTRALVDAGIGRVIAAMTDPYPEVAGRGLESLAEQGIDTAVGLLERDARMLNAGYLSRIENGRPRVTLKVAASLDGATAMQDGASQWISSRAARHDVQRLRAESGAILTGIGTVLADDPSLTVRDIDVREQPLRVILDSTLRLSDTAALLSMSGSTRIYCVDDTKRSALEAAGAEVVKADSSRQRVDIASVLRDLAAIGVNDVLVEAGPELAGSLVDRELVDRLVIYQAPHMMGSETRPMLATPGWQALEQRIDLLIDDVRRIGPDTRIIARPARANPDQ